MAQTYNSELTEEEKDHPKDTKEIGTLTTDLHREQDLAYGYSTTAAAYNKAADGYTPPAGGGSTASSTVSAGVNAGINAGSSDGGVGLAPASSGAPDPTSSTTEPRSSSGGEESTYQVKSGDSLSSIAETHNISLSALEMANQQITNPDLIYPGESINIPSGGTTTPADPASERPTGGAPIAPPEDPAKAALGAKDGHNTSPTHITTHGHGSGSGGATYTTPFS
jgi:LysM repeat protein